MGEFYPPAISGRMPPMQKTADGIQISVPFTNNRTISLGSVTGLKLIIKTVPNNILLTPTALSCDDVYSEIANFTISSTEDLYDKMLIGNTYKIQLAYYEGDTVGYYSTPGLVKLTGSPIAAIDGLDSEDFYLCTQLSFKGMFTFKEGFDDPTETLYSSCFNIYEDKGKTKLAMSSGELLYNTLNQTNENVQFYNFNKELLFAKSYWIEYVAKTNSGLEVYSKLYQIKMISCIDNAYDIYPVVQADNENGAIKIWLVSEQKNPIEAQDSGAFILGNFLFSRSRQDSNFRDWTNIFDIALQSNQIVWSYIPKETNLNDFAIFWSDQSVEHGKKYRYGVQEYNQLNFYSKRAISAIASVDFEDMFLFDGKRSLKLKFNPQVSSFKTNILEQKVETIGSKYPFFQRNSNVSYKEFPISALISFLEDDQNTFLTNQYANFTGNSYTNLSGENIFTERQFKLDVMQWLEDGESKLFRSPTEGNYFVRLLGVSLSPEATLGRMLHTFSATAYEIGEQEEVLNYVELKETNSSEHLVIGTYVSGSGQFLQDVKQLVLINHEIDEEFKTVPVDCQLVTGISTGPSEEAVTIPFVLKDNIMLNNLGKIYDISVGQKEEQPVEKVFTIEIGRYLAVYSISSGEEGGIFVIGAKNIRSLKEFFNTTDLEEKKIIAKRGIDEPVEMTIKKVNATSIEVTTDNNDFQHSRIYDLSATMTKTIDVYDSTDIDVAIQYAATFTTKRLESDTFDSIESIEVQNTVLGNIVYKNDDDILQPLYESIPCDGMNFEQLQFLAGNYLDGYTLDPADSYIILDGEEIFIKDQLLIENYAPRKLILGPNISLTYLGIPYIIKRIDEGEE